MDSLEGSVFGKLTKRPLVRHYEQDHIFEDVMAGASSIGINVLDHGYVRIVDFMPRLVQKGMTADIAITQAARVSYAKGTKTMKDEITLLRYLLRHRHCYAPWMQVLTAKGWKRWDKCREHEVFMVPDPVTRTYRPEKLSVESFDADESLICFKNNRMSFCVTPEHKMWFRGKYQAEYQTILARNMPLWGHFDPIVGYSLPQKNAQKDPLYQFVGFYLGDGSHASEQCLTFHLRKERKKTYLRDLLGKLGFTYSEKQSSTYADAVVFYVKITGPSFFDIVVPHVRAKDKALQPHVLSKLSVEELLGLWDGLVNSDGSVRNDRPQVEFSSTSLKLIQQFQTVAAFLGFDAHRRRTFKGVYRATAHFEGRTSLEARKQYFSELPYSGKVYCTTTSTGLLAVRGNSKEFGFICGNSTPFEMIEVKFEMAMPIFVARQFIRHRTASVNEVSARYTKLPEEFYIPAPEDTLRQSGSNKQGRDEKLPDEIVAEFRQWLTETSHEAHSRYTEFCDKHGIARELSRLGLPLNVYTRWYWKCDLHNILRFLSLRMDPHAQKEIRVYADAMYDLLYPFVPHTLDAWRDYVFESITLSSKEIEFVQRMIRSNDPEGQAKIGEELFPNERERREAVFKMDLLLRGYVPSR